MKILEKINNKLKLENKQKCTMFWYIPCPTDDDFEWKIEKFESHNDDLSNWNVILHKLKHLWKKEFDDCKDKHFALPRGIICNNVMFHGNNLPYDLTKVSEELGIQLGSEILPKYNKNFGIKRDNLEMLEKIINCKLNLQYTDF